MVETKAQNEIWRLLEQLRSSGHEARDFGVALAALIFVRWADFQEAELEAISAFEETEYRPALSKEFRWRNWFDHHTYNLNQFLHRLANDLERVRVDDSNPLTFYYSRIAVGIEILASYPEDVQRHLFYWLADQPFETPADRIRLRQVLDSVVNKTTDKYSASYITPREIAMFMTELVRPQVGEKVYDPCMGTGGLLTSALDYAKSRKVINSETKSGYSQVNGDPISVSGVDINSQSIAIAITRLALSGINDPKIEQGNSLERDAVNNPRSQGFDVILANPPWSMKVEPYGLGHFPVPTRDSSSLFLQHALSQLAPGGRAAVVLPSSFLYRSGRREVELRQMLIELHTIEAVVAIPSGAFAPFTSIETCLLLIRRGGTTKTIRMVDSSSIFEKAKNNPIAADPKQMALQLARQVYSPEEGVEYWNVNVESLVEIDFDLTPKRRGESELEMALKLVESESSLQRLDYVCEIMTGRAIRSNELAELPLSTAQNDMRPKKEILSERKEILGRLHRPHNRVDPGELDLNHSLNQRLKTLNEELEYYEHVESFDIPYIRIGDIQNGRVFRGSSWLTDEATDKVNAKWKLKYGDILVSKSGTIGKAGIVTNGAVGGIASQGLYVLRPHQGALDANYLFSYLSSQKVNDWLDSNARGSAAKHLSMKVFREMQVLVPPLQIQQRVAEQHKSYGRDAIDAAIQLLTGNETDDLSEAIEEWINTRIRILDEIETGADDYTVMSVFERLASDKLFGSCEECGEVYFKDYESQYLDSAEDYASGIETNCLACWLGVGPDSENITDAHPLSAWIIDFQKALKPLDGISQIPDFVGTLNVLQIVSVQAKSSLQALPKNVASAKPKKLVDHLLSSIDDYRDMAQHDQDIGVKVMHTNHYKNGDIEIAFEVTNNGSVPIRRTEFKLSPNLPPIESATIQYLGAGETYWLGFRGKLLFQEKVMEFVLSWTGRDLANEEFRGGVELEAELVERSSDEDMSNQEDEDFGTSPYIVGDPVKTDRPELFVGRQPLIDQIKRQIADTGNVVILEGNRRAGKSSVLWHLEGRSVDGWLGVYCTMQEWDADEANSESVSTVEVFRVIATAIAKKLRSEFGSAILPDGSTIDESQPYGLVDAIEAGIPEYRPFQRFREYVEIVIAQLEKQGLRLLLLLDEFDKLQESVRIGSTSKTVPENIRALLQSNSRISALLTGTKRMKRLRAEHFSVLFGLGTPHDVGSLTKEAAIGLITKPVKEILNYSKQAIEQACSLTACQPYLLQCLCQKIFVLAAEQKNRSITVDNVNAAAKELVRDNGHFVDLFNYAGSDIRRLILALCHVESQKSDLLRFKVIQEKLNQSGIAIQEDSLSQHLEWLLDYELLAYKGGDESVYSIAVPLLGDWLDLYQDYEALLAKARIELEESND